MKRLIVVMLLIVAMSSLAHALSSGALLVQPLPSKVESLLENKNALDVLEGETLPIHLPASELAEIRQRLTDEEWVSVIVWLKDNELTSPSYQRNLERKRDAIRQRQEAVLHTLEEEDFVLTYQFAITNGFAGKINEQGLEKLLRHSLVERVYLDRPVEGFLSESRPLLQADTVETSGVIGRGVGVCVLDSGIDYTHKALASRYHGGYDFVNGDADPRDDYGHGTHISGIIASTDIVQRGIAPGAQIAAVKVLGSDGRGTLAGVAAGIDWCVNNSQQHSLKVITMSLGTPGLFTQETCPASFDPALQNAVHSGFFIDAASGNSRATFGIAYPACAQGVVSVGATYDANVGSQTWPACIDIQTRADQIACLTNRASNLDVLAPGAIITSTTSVIGGVCGAPVPGFGACSGTSQAAPHVAGIAALLYEINPSLSPSQLENALKTSGVPVFDPATTLTFPRVDALAAVYAVRGNRQVLELQGEQRIGTTVSISVTDPLSANMNYIVLFSQGTSPGIMLPDGRLVPLNFDALFVISSLYPLWMDLRASQGRLDSQGHATATLRIPNNGVLIGTTVHTSFVTRDALNTRIASVSPAVSLRIQPP